MLARLTVLRWLSIPAHGGACAPRMPHAVSSPKVSRQRCQRYDVSLLHHRSDSHCWRRGAGQGPSLLLRCQAHEIMGRARFAAWADGRCGRCGQFAGAILGRRSQWGSRCCAGSACRCCRGHTHGVCPSHIDGRRGRSDRLDGSDPDSYARGVQRASCLSFGGWMSVRKWRAKPTRPVRTTPSQRECSASGHRVG